MFLKVVEDGYEFFAQRRLVTIFSAPNYGGEFDNAGALLNVDSSLICSFEILKPAPNNSKVPLKKVHEPFSNLKKAYLFMYCICPYCLHAF